MSPRVEVSARLVCSVAGSILVVVFGAVHAIAFSEPVSPPSMWRVAQSGGTSADPLHLYNPASGLCLDVTENHEGGKAIVNECAAEARRPSQRWQEVNGKLRNVESGLCLIPNPLNSVSFNVIGIILFDCSGANLSESWRDLLVWKALSPQPARYANGYTIAPGARFCLDVRENRAGGAVVMAPCGREGDRPFQIWGSDLTIAPTPTPTPPTEPSEGFAEAIAVDPDSSRVRPLTSSLCLLPTRREGGNSVSLGSCLDDLLDVRDFWTMTGGQLRNEQRRVCLDVAENRPGGAVVTAPCRDANALEFQEWHSRDGLMVQNTKSGLCLTARGKRVVVDTCRMFLNRTGGIVDFVTLTTQAWRGIFGNAR